MKILHITNLNTEISRELREAIIGVFAAIQLVHMTDGGEWLDELRDRGEHYFGHDLTTNCFSYDIIYNHLLLQWANQAPSGRYFFGFVKKMADKLKAVPNPQLALTITELFKQTLLHAEELSFFPHLDNDEDEYESFGWFLEQLLDTIENLLPEEAIGVLNLVISQIKARNHYLTAKIISPAHPEDNIESRIIIYIATIIKNMHPSKVDSTWNPANRPRKEETRYLVATKTKSRINRGFYTEKFKKSLLLMPGDLGRDLQVLLFNNVANYDSHWTIVEKQQQQLLKLKQKRIFPSRQPQVNYFVGPYSELTPSSDVPPFDFIWLDQYGNFMPKDLFWLKNECVPNTDIDNLDAWFTFYYFPRGNKFFLYCRELMRQNSDKFDNEFRKVFIETELDDKFLENIVVQWELLKYAFSNYLFDAEAWLYSDDQSVYMTLFHISNFSRRGRPYWAVPVIDYAIQNYRKNKPGLPVRQNPEDWGWF